jgi:PAS domain S-box-containing protein
MQSSAHILVVDDDRDTRELYRLVFESSGFRVSEAGSVADGLSLAGLAKPDVVLTDWRLADGNASELCAGLHHHVATRLIPIVAATGMSLSPEEVARARAVGCLEVLTKPVDMDLLVGSVHRAVDARASRRLRAATIRAGRFVARVRREQADETEMASLMVAHASRHGHSDVALIVANDSGQYVAANDSAAWLTGYPTQELTRLSVWDITPMPDTASVEDLWNRFIAAGTQEGRYTVLRRDGAPVHAQYVAIANIAPGLHLSALSQTASDPPSAIQ